VLRAMGRDREEAASSVRFSLGRHTTDAEIDRAVEAVTEVVLALRREHGGAGGTRDDG